MTIRIIDEPEIVLTRSEHDRLMREYKSFCSMHVSPPSFEDFVRMEKAEPKPLPIFPWSWSGS